MLFNGEDSDSDGELKINKEYANIYHNFRQKEELHKLKTRYGEDTEFSEDESNDSSSSEDENIQDQEFDKQFLITLACLKSEDPSIYDEKVKFNDISKPGTSESAEAKEIEKKSKKEKPISLRDYERKIILERDGRFSSSEDEDDEKRKAKSKMCTYVQEQKELKDSFKHAIKDEDEDEDNDLLKIKQKTEDEKHKEEESYKEWLKGQEVNIDLKDKEILKPLRDFWLDPNLDSNEKFLRDYILNNKYMDKESYDVDLEYNQIVHDSDENLSEDEKTIEEQEAFERKYNFRYEEPDQEFIKRYPRTMENSIRKKDTRRSQKRAEVKQRKEQEKQQKREELKQLKALKRKEIEDKIEKLKEITGNDDMCFDNVDFDSDFDPNEHDKRMKEIFNDEYYAGGEDEIQRPEFPEIDEELDIEKWDCYDPATDKIDIKAESREEPHCEDPDFNMDADYDESRDLQSKLIETTKQRIRKRRSKFAELIAKEKPKFDPKQFPSYADYFDQYYSLDYEDMIGDLPCRFKYRKVMPNDYGLSVEEILMADDKELNRWCSLRQALKYKPEHVEQNEIRIYQEKSMNEANKQKILKSLYTEQEEKKEEKDEHITEQTETNNKKRRRKKKIKTSNLNAESTDTDIVSREKIIQVTNDDVQNNLHNSNDESRKEEKNENAQEKNIVNKNEKQKRKNNLKVNSDAPISKKIKMDNITKEDPLIKTENNIENNNKNKVEINNKIKTENINKKVAIDKFTSKKKNKNRNSQFNQMNTRKRKSNYDDPTMSLNAERLKTYGINAKKLKNKLKYGNKRL
ncbi:PREDICTED: protein KRI1 homolog [Cyphomyrmex costatus]|uniref:Protein KRI1 homolog n=1 Tax=Cyphomyrmex costatus TaxID=456900 RepID=A0A195C445_9HYME|nr:PREDICTED: protein KRI1 homolog [Cyphomyrmex costatus]KYM95390.1 Protein KRI1 like protein [Cyphomyrmex costatus]